MFSLSLNVTDPFTGVTTGYSCTAYSFGAAATALPPQADGAAPYTCYYLSSLGAGYGVSLNEYRWGFGQGR